MCVDEGKRESKDKKRERELVVGGGLGGEGVVGMRALNVCVCVSAQPQREKVHTM